MLQTDNQLGGEGMKGISVGLKVNTALKKLILNSEWMNTNDKIVKHGMHLWGIDNAIGNEGIQSLSRALLLNTTLTQLDVSGELENIHGKRRKWND